MKHQKLLSDIFDLLDPEIYKTAYFQELKKIILTNCPNDDITFRVSSEVYNVLKEFNYSENIEVSSEFILEIDTYGFTLRIAKTEGILYVVELKMRTKDLETITEYYFSTEMAIIEATQLKIANGYYSTFDCSSYYYCGKDLAIPLDINVNGYKDLAFSKKFGLPQILANYFRKNFTKLAPIIEFYEETGELSCLDPFLEPNDYAAFLRPFQLLEFEEFIIGQFYYEIDGLLEDPILNNAPPEELPLEEVDYLIDDLIKTIGSDGTCIISHNIYQSICMYLLGYADSLETKGLIIKKTDDGYHLFSISIQGYHVLAIEQEASQKDILELYQCNPLNEDIPELKDFFTPTRGR